MGSVRPGVYSWNMGVEAFAGRLRRWATGVGRKLTTPGNRTPLDESQQQRPGLRSSDTEGSDTHIIK
jgi:hypothetical protein